jgi:hypothetical protein
MAEAHDTIDQFPASEIFILLGKDSEGYIHFRCPSCGEDLRVDSIKSIFSMRMNGIPTSSTYFQSKIENSAKSDTWLWLLLLILVAIRGFISIIMFRFVLIIIITLILLKLTGLSGNIASYFNSKYANFPVHPPQKRRLLILVHLNNVAIITILYLSFINHTLWLIIPIIILSLLLFMFTCMFASGGFVNGSD